MKSCSPISPQRTCVHSLFSILQRASVVRLLPPQPRFAYQREISQATLWPRRYTAEDLSISIQVERGTSRRDALQLIGLVTRKGEALGVLQGTPVLLSAQGVGISFAGTQ